MFRTPLTAIINFALLAFISDKAKHTKLQII